MEDSSICFDFYLFCIDFFNFKFFVVFITFSISMYIICMLVQRFEPQGRRFTTFHYYYYQLSQL